MVILLLNLATSHRQGSEMKWRQKCSAAQQLLHDENDGPDVLGCFGMTIETRTDLEDALETLDEYQVPMDEQNVILDLWARSTEYDDPIMLIHGTLVDR